MAMKLWELKTIVDDSIARGLRDVDVRIGDVAEGSDLHCSVGVVELRGNCIVLTPGDDDVWKDETVASAQMSEHLWSTGKDATDET